MCLAGFAKIPAAEEATGQQAPQSAAGSAVQYLPLGAPEGMSQAVIVPSQPLLHTRQLLALDREGKLMGAGSVDQQIEQVLDNLHAVLTSAGSGLNQLVRLNVYSLAPATVGRVRELLSKRLAPGVRPTITAVLTPLPHRQALVAVDAVAVLAAPASDAASGPAVALQRCDAMAGDKDCADVGILPRGGIAYLSGAPAEGGLTTSAVGKSMAILSKTLAQLQLSAAHVVHLKVFLRPALSADEVRQELKRFFPGQITPPLVFVEWLAPPPVEIELIAQLPGADTATPSVQYYNPPDVSPLQIFSRVALVRSDRQIYTSGLFARAAGRGDDQARDVFAQLQSILAETGSDLRHLVKATYYASDDEAARGFDRVRLALFAPDCPPAASKLMVHGVGQASRGLTMDLIAVGRSQP
jgi:enamine deaminase RidA (YjgF/YER057c/UK114 family)